jgi:hypothetical protein
MALYRYQEEVHVSFFVTCFQVFFVFLQYTSIKIKVFKYLKRIYVQPSFSIFVSLYILKDFKHGFIHTHTHTHTYMYLSASY